MLIKIRYPNLLHCCDFLCFKTDELLMSLSFAASKNKLLESLKGLGHAILGHAILGHALGHAILGNFSTDQMVKELTKI